MKPNQKRFAHIAYDMQTCRAFYNIIYVTANKNMQLKQIN